MPTALKHNLFVKGTREQAAKQDFVSGLRAFVLNDMADTMKTHYVEDVEPALSQQGHAPSSGRDVHQTLKSDFVFNCYSRMRYNARKWSGAAR